MIYKETSKFKDFLSLVFLLGLTSIGMLICLFLAFAIGPIGWVIVGGYIVLLICSYVFD